MISAWGAGAASLETRVELWLRLLTLVAGLVVAVLTAVSLWRQNRLARMKEESELVSLRRPSHDGAVTAPGPEVERCEKERNN